MFPYPSPVTSVAVEAHEVWWWLACVGLEAWVLRVSNESWRDLVDRDWLGCDRCVEAEDFRGGVKGPSRRLPQRIEGQFEPGVPGKRRGISWCAEAGGREQIHVAIGAVEHAAKE